MSLPLVLNTNEIKDAAGAEIEFQRLGDATDRKLSFFKVGESYALPIRLDISHQEFGAGIKRRRRSVVGFSETSISTVDLVTPCVCRFYTVADIPVGALLAQTVAARVNAMLMSFMASKGASTTILYDGTGYGSEVALNGSL